VNSAFITRVKIDIDVINNDFHGEFTLRDIQISARVKPYRTHNIGILPIWPCCLPAWCSPAFR
ncbi:MAG: hypothetical protein M3O71_32410, partial [Bacteroidota bacterium]|nr:hypothetical protein [Bacteroidota bacterium]